MANPPKVLVVLGHGRAERSLCHSLEEVVCAELKHRGAELRRHRLLEDGFDPVLRLTEDRRHATINMPGDEPLLRQYQEDVRWADGYVFIHPVWWFAPPAILKGWVDRVLVDGVALQQPVEGPPSPLLEGRSALVIQTFNVPYVVDRVAFRGIAAAFWRRVVLPSVGARFAGCVALHSVEGIDADQMQARFQRVRKALAAMLAALSPT